MHTWQTLRTPLGVTLISIALVTLWRLLVLATSPMGLYGDEAQYWTWAQQLDWGYYSKPPLIAWQIWLTTAFCGDTPSCVRLASPFLHATTAGLLALIASRLFSPRAGLYAALVYLLMPGVSLSSVVATTDAPMLLFWTLALYAFIRALDSTHIGWWLAAGAAAGLGMLSKYNAVFFAVSAFLFLLLSPAHRPILRQPGPWLAAGTGALVYLPNLLWNWAHDFPSYRHTGEISGVGDGLTLSLDGLGKFFIDQLGVFGPIAFPLLLLLLLQPRLLRSTKGWQLAWAMTLPWLLVVIAISSQWRTHANWSAPAYIGGALLVGAWLAMVPRRWLFAALLASHLLLATGIYHYDRITNTLGIELTSRSDPFKQVRNWESFGKALRDELDRHPTRALVTDDRMFTAQILYQLRERPHEVVRWNAEGRHHDYYTMTTSMEGREGDDLFLLLPAPSHGRARLMAPYFDHLERIAEIRVPIHTDLGRDYDLWLARGFRGY